MPAAPQGRQLRGPPPIHHLSPAPPGGGEEACFAGPREGTRPSRGPGGPSRHSFGTSTILFFVAHCICLYRQAIRNSQVGRAAKGRGPSLLLAGRVPSRGPDRYGGATREELTPLCGTGAGAAPSVPPTWEPNFEPKARKGRGCILWKMAPLAPSQRRIPPAPEGGGPPMPPSGAEAQGRRPIGTSARFAGIAWGGGASLLDRSRGDLWEMERGASPLRGPPPSWLS